VSRAALFVIKISDEQLEIITKSISLMLGCAKGVFNIAFKVDTPWRFYLDSIRSIGEL